MGIFAILFGCGPSNKNKPQGGKSLEEITSWTDTSECFADIFLTIVSEVKTDSSHVYIAKGLYEGKTVGLKFEVKSNIPNGITPQGNINPAHGFVHNAVRISSIGKESNEFVSALGDLYSSPTSGVFSRQVISATAFSLNQKVADLTKSDYYKFKLFFEDGNEELYSELFFNINTKEQTIALQEKDQEYREPLIKVFSN